MAVSNRLYPNFPGVFESGPFRLRINKFHGGKQISVVYKEKLLATIDAGELVDLKEVVDRMASFLTDESFAKLPPDAD